MFERFTTDARSAVVAAQTRAAELKSERIGTEHLFLGALDAAPGPLRTRLADAGISAEDVARQLRFTKQQRATTTFDDDAAALESIGIDLGAIRSSIEANFGEGVLDAPDDRRGWFSRRTGHLPLTPAAKKTLELSLREALSHKDSEIGVEHLLYGLIRGADAPFLALVDVARLREVSGLD